MNRRRITVGLVGTASALLTALVVGGGWVYAGQLLPAPARDRTLDVTATVTSDGRVVLPPERRSCLDRFGLLLDGAYLRYGGLVDGTCDGEGTVTRRITSIDEGDPVRDEPQGARFDEYIWLGDPSTRGLDHQEVAVQTELGPAPAWLLEGDRERWIIVVHGRSATRTESLRLLPTLVDSGLTTLAITYRNDFAGGPDAGEAVGRFGTSEWQDLAAAVGHARDHGARDVVLLGYSQGASLIGFYLRERGADDVAGIVLDSPLLDLPETLVQQARLRGIPDPLIPPILFGTRWISRVRAGLDVGAVDHVDTFIQAQPPVLLLHGPEDDFVPVGPSERLAEARDDGLTYERFPTAGHVEGFNAEPDRYTRAVGEFLRDLPRPSPS